MRKIKTINAIKNITKVMLSAVFAVSAIFGASQVSTYAEDKDVKLTTVGETKGETVSARFTVTRQTITDLGYDTVVTIPVEIELALNTSTKKFEGSGSIAAYGILDTNQVIKVDVKDTDSAYGVINGPSSYSQNLKDKGFSTTLSKKKWTPADCCDNLEKKADGDDLSESNVGTLAVSIPGTKFIPKYMDDYTTTIPLTISLVTE